MAIAVLGLMFNMSVMRAKAGDNFEAAISAVFGLSLLGLEAVKFVRERF